MMMKLIKSNLYSFLLAFHVVMAIIYLSHRVTDEKDIGNDVGKVKVHNNNLTTSSSEEEKNESTNYGCNAFSRTPLQLKHCSDSSSVSMKTLYGRLGNRIIETMNMIAYAEEMNCGVKMPENILEHWSTPTNTCYIPNIRKSKSSSCGPKRGKEWFYFYKIRPSKSKVTTPCGLQLLSTYFGVNRTHALGRSCPTSSHSVLHIRSGDIVKGRYDTQKGVYVPTHVHPGYTPYPTSYYLSVLKSIASKSKDKEGHPPKVYVLCETLNNPTCDYFLKTADLLSDVQLILRVGQSLIDDLHILLCASEVAVSVGTFHNILLVSQKLNVKHDYSKSVNNCSSSSSSNFHWIASRKERNRFAKVTDYWNNTGFQRHIIDGHYKMASCEDSNDNEA